MATIKKLSDALIDQIAAGEVVDRPASAVKELTENAIDAGAEKIEIRLVDGGIGSIWVKDDGLGMAEADLMACTDRHATSKVACFDDLYSLATMGFRGEALASIAAVSNFTIRSRRRGASEGHQLVIADGVKTISPWSGSEGTAVTVADLFGAVPARRKFLKKPAAEYIACLETLTALALANPQVALTLHHQDKMVFAYSRGSLKLRVEQVWQSKLQGKGLLAVNASHNLAKLEGYISPPGLGRGTGKDIYIFVNGRYIKDQKLRYAVLRGYHSHLLKGRFPMVVLRLTVDPSLVDVNVSPAKTEIRLQYSDEITSFISATLKDKIREGAWADQSFDRAPGASRFQPAPSHAPSPSIGLSSPEPMRSTPEPMRSAPEPMRAAREPMRSTPEPMRAAPRPASGDSVRDDLSQLLGPGVKVSSRSVGGSGPSYVPVPLEVEVAEEVQAEGGAFDFNDLRFVGTFFECYLAYEWGEKLLFIDQHAFHERILFEKLRSQHEAMLAPQPLLIAEGCQLSPAAVADISAATALLQPMGIEVTAVSDHCVEVSALPALLHRTDPGQLLEDVAAVLATYDSPSAAAQADLKDRLYDDLYSTIACHSAIRSGEVLTEQDRLELEQDASGVDFYLNCPHGRRVFKWLSLRQVAGWFDRT